MADHNLASSDTLVRTTDSPVLEQGVKVAETPSQPVTHAQRIKAAQRLAIHGRARSDVFGDALDLADPANRLGTSPDINSRIEQKRLEHERQRAMQKQLFDDQMKALAEKQAQEEQELLARAASKPASNGVTTKSGPTKTATASDTKEGQTHPAGAKSDSATPPMAASGHGTLGNRKNSVDKDSLTEKMKSLTVNGVPAGIKQASGTEPTPELAHFLFDDELDAELQNSAFGGKYLQMNTDDDKFPILIRRDDYPGMLSASSAALDLAPLSQTPPRHGLRGFDPARTSEWPQFAGQNAMQQPHNRSVTSGSAAALDRQQQAPLTTALPGGRQLPPPQRAVTIDVQTRQQQQQQQQQQPQTSGRTSPTVELSPQKKLSGPVSTLNGSPEDKRRSLIGHTGSAPNLVRPPSASDLSNYPNNTERVTPSAFAQYTAQQSPTLGMGMGGSAQTSAAFPYDPYSASGFAKNNASVPPSPYGIRGPKPLADSTNRFSGLRLEDLQGDMASLCKDQHGCRFLQRKLEEGKPEYRDMIYTEIFPVFADLMTDPFANYLAQRLLEFATDEQRDALVDSISGSLVAISLNMHGTRAVQKMIDFLTTGRQVQSLILALNLNVVALIKDLNGNHVIQKCLNTLPPEDNQFIYNAVAANCVEVATHRHGCCVLQRCIDHASESQRIQLVTEITYQSLSLVQDAFGNYVVQYIVDCDSRFAEAIVRQFLGNVCALSCQKFSSNVVEKCIRVSDAVGRKAMIDELLDRNALERLLNDPFGNYVLQTCLDYAEGPQRSHLINMLRPLLPAIRNTPHGKRITQKIQREVGRQDGMRGGYHGHLGQVPPPLYQNYPGFANGMSQHHVPVGPQHSPPSLVHPSHNFGANGPFAADGYGRAFSNGANVGGNGSNGSSPTQPFNATFGGTQPALFGGPLGVESYGSFQPF